MSDLQPQESAPEITPQPAPGFAIATEQSYGRTLFLGLGGLRPGWGFLFYAISFLILQRLVSDLVVAYDLGASGLWVMLLEEFGWVLAATVPALVLWRIERRPWAMYGLPARLALGKQFWVGALWGFAAISLLIGALFALNDFSFGHVVLHGIRVFKYGSFWLAMFLLVGLYEEFAFRGYSQFTLARGIGFWPSAIALSIVFGLMHRTNSGEQWPGLLAAACIGLFFCLTLRRTGSLWFAVGFHAAWDWGETFFYSVPDSGLVAPGHLLSSSVHGPPWLTGGSVGPEGSLLCFVVIAIVWIAFERTHPAVHSGGSRGAVLEGQTELSLPQRL